MDYHGLTLTHVKSYPAMSQETACGTAKLYMDGEHIGDVRNDGQGGPWSIHANDNQYIRELNTWLDEERAKEEGKERVFETLDYIISMLFGDTEERQHAVKRIRNNVLAFDPESNKVYKFPKRRGATRERTMELVAEKYPTYIVLNNLPQAEAVALFVKYT